MKHVKAVCFDLDDTLWDLEPVIPRAEKTLYAWYEMSYPAVLEHFSPQDILALRQRVALENPELRHDLTQLRLKVLRTIAVQSGYLPGVAEEAFEVFQAARNQVDVFADVVPALERLAASYRLLTLSNGNADLDAIGIAHHFAASYSAREIGAAKPAAEVFQAVCRSEGLEPAEILHVGDHPENDIVAAQRMGMRTVWVNRREYSWPSDKPAPDETVACLEELAALLMSEPLV